MLNDNDILIWRGFKWKRLFVFDSYHITAMLIQLVTLSKWTHTAIFKRYKEKCYLVQANLSDGLHIVEISEDWLNEEIDKLNIKRIKPNYEKYTKFASILDSYIKYLFDLNINKKNFGKYSISSLLNQIPFNIIGKDFYKRSKLWSYVTTNQKAICSELTFFYFTEYIESHLFAPSDFADNNIDGVFNFKNLEIFDEKEK